MVGELAQDARLRIGDPVAIVRADGSRLPTTGRGIELPCLLRAVGITLGPEVAKADIAPGDEVVREGPPRD